MNTPVNFELAKLLKEKGFNLKVINFYNYEKLSLISDKNRQVDGLVNYNPINWNGIKDHYTSAPTIAEVVMWLYEKHGVWVYCVPFVNGSKTETFWLLKIEGANVNTLSSSSKDYIQERQITNNFKSPIEAYQAGIKYSLNNLIS